MNDEMIDRIAKALRELHIRTLKAKHEEHKLLWTQFKEQYPDKTLQYLCQVTEVTNAIELANYVVVQPQDIVQKKKVVHLTPQRVVPPTAMRAPKIRMPMIIRRRLQEQNEKPTRK